MSCVIVTWEGVKSPPAFVIINPLYILLYIYMSESSILNKRSLERERKENGSAPKRSRRKIVKSQSSQTERQLYYPDLYEYKKLDMHIEKKRIVRGSWSLQENKIYLEFLSRNKRDFGSEEIRRKTVVFNRLSKELHKRTPDQCRSHHQKLQNRFSNDIDLIIEFVQRKIKKRDSQFQIQRQLKEEKFTRPTRTSENSDFQEGIIINFDELMIW